MDILSRYLCWKCQTEKGTYFHALWECKLVSQSTLRMTIPTSQRLCSLGDKSDVPQNSKYDFTVIKVGAITATRLILRLWKAMLEFMSQVVAYEHMLATIHNDSENDERPRERFLACNVTDILWLLIYYFGAH